MSTRRSRRWMLPAIAALLVVGLIAAIFAPQIGMAWPWDDDREVTVTGRLQCMNVDVGSPLKWGIAKVEWFEIAGRAGVLDNRDPYNPRYEVTVPPGWKVEWYLKCTGSAQTEGSFTVDKTTFGSGYSQQRTICSDNPNIFAPCVPTEIGGCVTLWLDGFLPSVSSFEDAVEIWADVYANEPGGPSDAELCLRALTAHLSAPTPPTVPAVVPTLPPATYAPLPTLAPVTAPPATAPPATAPPATAPPATAPPATPPPVTPPPVTAAPAPTGWQETTGGVANTWTNYSNAGGNAGPQIAKNQTVTISCAIEGFRVQDGNIWWYRIASAPWNNQYYVSADVFYNNGSTSGSLSGTPFVDPAVPHC